MTKREINIWDILFWLGMIILILYILAKIFGIINTPEWINLIPLITLAFVIGAFYQRVSGFMERMLNRTDYLKKNINNIKINLTNSLDNVINGLDNLTNKLNEHDKRLFAIEKQQEIVTKSLITKRK